MRIHFIAIGGSAMHNLALALHRKGHEVTGSDDEIYEPSRSRLYEAGLLPDKMGWDPEKITSDIDHIILGMHAREDNPELRKAEKLGVPIYSYPSYIAEVAHDKKRVVIAGSHGKTTTTSMVMEAMRSAGVEFDYLVGAQLPGYQLMVRLSEADTIIIEGDEYLSSPIDRRPKFLHYQPQIAVITGIAWDHINVFKTFEDYVRQFALFVDTIQADGYLIYNENDEEVVRLIGQSSRKDLHYIPYNEVPLTTDKEILVEGGKYYPQLVGKHNYQNMAAAQKVCDLLGLSQHTFYRAMEGFTGAAKRLQVIVRNEEAHYIAYRDFAHAPSKVAATVAAIKEWYPDRKLITALELHTFSSLNNDFLPLYKDTLGPADKALVFYNDHTLKMKKMPMLNPEDIARAFAKKELVVTTKLSELKEWISEQKSENSVFLLMTSGNFQGIDLQKMLEY